MDIKLIRPAQEHKDQAIDYRKEYFDHGEFIINGSELLDKMDLYEEWLAAVTNNADPKTVNPNWFLTDTFFAVDCETQKIVGMIDLRHTLNDFLVNFGNCGYSVRPSERRKGYAAEMLGQLLHIAKNAGLQELHITAERNNISSIKTIIKNGGKYERSFEYEGKQAEIYTINL